MGEGESELATGSKSISSTVSQKLSDMFLKDEVEVAAGGGLLAS